MVLAKSGKNVIRKSWTSDNNNKSDEKCQHNGFVGPRCSETGPKKYLVPIRTKILLKHLKFKTFKKDGVIHIKTDSEFLFGYSLGILKNYPGNITFAHHDIYNNPNYFHSPIASGGEA